MKKTKDYRKCRVELFAENSLKHGMMQRVTHFSDLARTNAVAVEEMFANRKDQLRRRVRYYKAGSQIEIGRPESLIEEYFDPGRPDALMELVERPDGEPFQNQPEPQTLHSHEATDFVELAGRACMVDPLTLHSKP